MGTGYTRNDSANNIADGNVINASDLDGEFDAVQAAFNGTTGHSHDGTSGEGPQIAAGGIASNAVTTAKILDANVTTAKIADANVTVAKMAANSVDSAQYVDGSIDTAHIADNAITLAKMASGTDGNIISFDASGNPVAIATGTDGQVLTSTGAGSPPAFEDAAGGGAVSAVANGSNNRIATFSSGDALNGEANLTFDGTDFVVAPGGNTRFNVQASETHMLGSDFYFNAGTGSGLGNKYFNINAGTGRDGGILFKRNNANVFQFAMDSGSDDDLSFYSYGTNSTVLKIDRSDGRIGINAPSVLAGSSEKLSVSGTSGITIKTNDYSDYQPLIIWNNASNGNNSTTMNLITFISLGNGTVGTITSVGTTTSYNTSSDYRLKENVDYTWDATTRLKQLKPARFNWISDSTNTTVDGFLAHEVSSIVPEAITGEKDETETSENCIINSIGNLEVKGVTEQQWTAGKIPTLWTEDDELPDGVSVGDIKQKATYASDTTWTASHTQDLNQSIDQSKLVPLLVKTIQELEARITVLEG